MTWEEEEEQSIPISQRAEWSDVKPLPQDDGPTPVVPIAYRDDFRETMDYFRAIYASDERSLRALQLTNYAIRMNPGNYTVWHFRRHVLDALGADLREEADFVSHIAQDNSKNYQLWHHRRWIAEKLGTDCVDVELTFTKEILALDAKNYHAWSHRQWVLRNLGGWEDELSFCDHLINDDLFNNSAWNQRYFVITQSPLLEGLPAMRESEIDYSTKAIKLNPSNESPWRYLRGLYKGEPHLLIDNPRVPNVCWDVLKKDPNCTFALGLLVDLLCYGFQPTVELENFVKGLHHVEQEVADSKLSVIICSILASVDIMRRNYWMWRKSMLCGET